MFGEMEKKWKTGFGGDSNGRFGFYLDHNVGPCFSHGLESL
jgi:hypothetical protein